MKVSEYAKSMAFGWIKDSRGHEWKTEFDGTVDLFGYNPVDPHNGPLCIKCGYGYCHHCRDEPEIECPENLHD